MIELTTISKLTWFCGGIIVGFTLGVCFLTACIVVVYLAPKIIRNMEMLDFLFRYFKIKKQKKEEDD